MTQLTTLAGRLGWQQALVITDANLLDAKVVEPVLLALAAGGVQVEVFGEGEAEPSIAVAEASMALANETNRMSSLVSGADPILICQKTPQPLLLIRGIPPITLDLIKCQDLRFH